ncbi:MAG: hypothetical protein IPJ14_06810 [Kineosporiaceae bacterium]|nr:hypothetical protein [Kineosporiaceae bacterium]MBK7622376.1 hypothetical protein [Kineosporiaceae bacterium]MBK8074707.1 hypothetical protein [Kineosporiaceae bacterium]
MEPGQLALIPVTFVEDRDGRALVRLPNGSKTSIEYDVLDARAALTHFIRSVDGRGVTALCMICRDLQETDGWSEAVAAAERHHRADHESRT